MINNIKKETIQKIINEIDPIGLLDLDTPESLNEYKTEVERIFNWIKTNFEENELAKTVYNIFVEYFGEDSVGKKII